jgi:anti-sigma B factor antagonist
VLTSVDNADTSPPHLPFEIGRSELDGRTSVVSVQGELDLATAPQLKWMLVDALDEGRDQIVLDLTRTSFMDSTALGVLVGFKRSLDQEGSLAVICGEGNVRKIFELSGMDGVFKLFSDLSDAVAHAQERVAHSG